MTTTVQYMDGFDYWDTFTERYNDYWGAWSNGTWANNLPLIGAYGRRGTNGVRLQKKSSGLLVYIGAISGDIVFGCAHRRGTTNRTRLFAFGTDASNPTLYASVDSAGILGVYSYSGSYGYDADEDLLSDGTSSVPVMRGNMWVYIEFVIAGVGGAGTVDVYLNGSPTAIVSASGTIPDWEDFFVIGSPKWSYSVGDPTQTIDHDIDDLYLAEGDSEIAHLGDPAVFTKYPTGPGTDTEWTPSGASGNWPNVDEAPPNTTDYNYSNTDEETDLYVHDGLPSYVDTVYARAVNLYMQKATPGTREVCPLIYDFAGYTEGDLFSPALEEYMHYQSMFDGCTKAQADDTEFGMRIKT